MFSQSFDYLCIIKEQLGHYQNNSSIPKVVKLRNKVYYDTLLFGGKYCENYRCHELEEILKFTSNR